MKPHSPHLMQASAFDDVDMEIDNEAMLTRLKAEPPKLERFSLEYLSSSSDEVIKVFDLQLLDPYCGHGSLCVGKLLCLQRLD